MGSIPRCDNLAEKTLDDNYDALFFFNLKCDSANLSHFLKYYKSSLLIAYDFFKSGIFFLNYS